MRTCWWGQLIGWIALSLVSRSFGFHSPTIGTWQRPQRWVPAAGRGTEFDRDIPAARATRLEGRGGRLPEGFDRASLTLTDPRTNVTVVLLGCFHGSQSSAQDVQAMLHPPLPQVIALELCASRFKSLRSAMQQRGTHPDTAEGSPWQANTGEPQQQPTPLVQFRRWISDPSLLSSQPSGSLVSSTLLGFVSSWQTAMAGLEAGLEFRTALVAVDQAKDSSCDILLADQAVEQTLWKLEQLPAVLMELVEEAVRHGWERSFGREAKALNTAMFGCDAPQSLSVGSFMTRSAAARQDMLRLLAIPLLGIGLVSWLLSLPSEGIPVEDMAGSMVGMAVTGEALRPIAASIIVNLSLLSTCYMGVALPAARVILRERDDCLARNIQAACRVAAQQQGSGQARVVAVLGLLHVNGVAQRLLQKGSEETQDAAVGS